MPAFAGMTVCHRNVHPRHPGDGRGPFGLAGFRTTVSMDASLRWHDGETLTSRHPGEGRGPFGLAGFRTTVDMDASLRWHDGETSKPAPSRHPSEGWGPCGLAGSHIAISMDASLRWHDGATSGVVTIPLLPTPLRTRRLRSPDASLMERPCLPGGLRAGSGRGVAQPGRALSSGGRGRRFESSLPDHYTLSR
jgi:hypothetical protein